MISLGNCRTTENYALQQFEVIIRNITRACSMLGIDDFSTLTISAKNINDLNLSVFQSVVTQAFRFKD